MVEGTGRDPEELASRFVDGEIEVEDRQELLFLIDENPDFRDRVRDYREHDSALVETGGFIPPSCPPLPGRRRHWSRLLVPALAGVAAVMFFAAGAWFGQERALKHVPSFARVAAPAAWLGPALPPGAPDFGPLTGLIAHYQAEVALELEKTQPDWGRIRDLMVTLGSLRTDLELLSLHEQYRRDPAGGASDWRRMLGMTAGEKTSL